MKRSPALASLLLLSACSASNERKLEGHVFDVPTRNIVSDGAIPFLLPASDPADGFSFVLNPEAKLPDQILIGVAGKTRTCARAAGAKAGINSMACAAQPPAWRNRVPDKTGDKAFWTYVLPSHEGQQQPAELAGCFAAVDPNRPGFCSANLLYGDLILTIHFKDNALASLEGLYDQAAAKLRNWER